MAVVCVALSLGAFPAEAGTRSYTYDAHGRLKSVAVPNGVDTTTTTYGYDAANNQTSVVVQTKDISPPTIPTNVKATATSWQQISLSWSASTDVGSAGMSGYRVYRGNTLIASPTTTSYVDQGLSGSTSYTYYVSAVDKAGNESAVSAPAPTTTLQVPDTTPPSVPTNLKGTAVSGTWINLTWNASQDNVGGTGLAGYEIFRNSVKIGTSTVASYSDQSASPATTYTYQVLAYDAAVPTNKSALSSAVPVTTLDTIPPSAPGAPTFSAITTSGATATWSEATDNVGVTGYRYSLNGGVSWITIGSAPTTNLSGLGSANTYTMLVQARDAAGNWGPSSSGSFTTSAGVYTETIVVTSGDYDDSSWFMSGKGPTYGSVSPATTANGLTYYSITDSYYWQFDWDSQSYFLYYYGSAVQVSGFSADPGAGWLISFNGKVGTNYHYYPNGVASWNVPQIGFYGLPKTLTIIHR
jgi:chitodextrinase